MQSRALLCAAVNCCTLVAVCTNIFLLCSQYRDAAWHGAKFDMLAARARNDDGTVAGARELGPLQTGSGSAATDNAGDAANETLAIEDAVAYFKSNAFLPRMSHRDLNLLWQQNVGKRQDGISGVTRSQFLAMVGGILASVGGQDKVSRSLEDSAGSRNKPVRHRAQTADVMTAHQRSVADTAGNQSMTAQDSPFPHNASTTPTQARGCTAPWMDDAAAGPAVSGDTGRRQAATRHAAHL